MAPMLQLPKQPRKTLHTTVLMLTSFIFHEYTASFNQVCQNLKDVDLETRKDIVPRIAGIVVHLG